MKYYTRWQPLIDEDAHTALTFGFMRHAPIDVALAPWLSEVLHSNVVPSPLMPQSFWPRFPSVVDGSAWTEPELVFDAHDGKPLVVVVEAKLGFDAQRLEQVSRELVDVINDCQCPRIALIMVGPDPARSMPLRDWRAQLAATMATHGYPETCFQIEYASWASLGQAIEAAGVAVPQLAEYANDVVAQLRRKELLGYSGSPVLDDLDKMTVVKAVEAFNRTVAAIRQFFLQLHGLPGFKDLGLGPNSKNYKIQRDGGSEVPTQRAEWFATHALLSAYRKPKWAAGRHAFVAFDLVGEKGEPLIYVGAGVADKGTPLAYNFSEADNEVEPDDAGLIAARDEFADYVTSAYAQWICDARPWRPDQPEDDLAWTVQRLAGACRVWDNASASPAN